MEMRPLLGNSKQNIFHWISIIGLLLIIALPLLNLPPWFSPPDWGKTILFRIILSSLLVVLVFEIFFRNAKTSFFSPIQTILKKPIKETLPFWLLLAFFAMNLLATIFSQDPWFSLWGDPHRSGGFVNFVFYVALALFAFLLLRPSQWKFLWNFSFGIGILVSLVGIFQHFSIFSNIFVPLRAQVSSTLGGPWVLGIYLILLSFIALSYGIQERRRLQKFGYLFLFLLFGYIILLTVSQAAYLGFGVGFLFFIFFYPRKLRALKIGAFIGLAAAILILYSLSTLPDHPFSQSDTIQNLTEWKVDQSRLSTWKVSIQAFQERPLLGYGPENFSIGFDAYYDPSLPEISKQPHFGALTSWWDRAHNIFLETAVTTGGFGAFFYLAFFVTLLWMLQRFKKQYSEYALMAHGIQAALLGYLVAAFFGFDGFSTYLILFLLIGFSFSLLYRRDAADNAGEIVQELSVTTQTLYKLPIFLAILLLFTLFIWIFHIRPLQINTQINIAGFFVDQQQCLKVIESMDLLTDMKNPLLDAYIKIQFVDYLRKCQQQLPEQRLELAQKGIDLLKEHVKLRPTYTRSWIFLGGFTNMLLEAEVNATSKDPKRITRLTDEANSYFQEALRQSPKHQETYIEWTKTFLINKDYHGAKKKAQECIGLNTEIGECWWLLGRAELSLGNTQEGNNAIQQAAQRDYPLSEEEKKNEDMSERRIAALLQLINAHLASQNYIELVQLYVELVELRPEAAYYGSLAVAYREIEEFEKARDTALKVQELDPTLQTEVKLFINSLPL